jgi:hypothetical protein
MIEGSAAKPHSFDERHYALAMSYGIDRERIQFFSNLEQLKIIAANKGVPNHEIKDYTETTNALWIQVDEIRGGPDLYICLINSLSEKVHIDSVIRLLEWYSEPLGTSQQLEALGDTKRPEVLYAYLLLHEIGHNQLKHGSGGDYLQKEEEADRWALQNLPTGFYEN